MITSWEALIKAEFEFREDDFSKIITTLSKEELKKEFDNNYGEPASEPFLAWSQDYVYFSVCYDGLMSVEEVNSAFFEELKKTGTVKRHFSFTFANASNFIEVERCLKLCGVRYVAHHIHGYSNIFIDKLEISY